MKAVKIALIINVVTLGINGLIVWLTIIKSFPAILGVALVVGFLAGAIWLSCYANGVLPSQRRHYGFHAAPTEHIERV